ncbi:hypothetical protein Q7W57_13845 [Stenotrophomonas geniculata]|uniref:Uncharacterized protein n=1 Tax=Stenotrophomonas geniculata TaxID=86188 RepID=A0AAP5C845_9GAMM|nr:hypothetical protein [Stenotrophomonas geniculata]MDP4309486.1 hypothetical protein [Stenotrophomonas geniculata]MDQ7952869.1 hypothetical protein [Stenotrophomonas geniculata]
MSAAKKDLCVNLLSPMGLGARDFSAAASMPPVVSVRKTKHDLADYGYMRSVMHFIKWAHEQDKFPTANEVISRFQVSRATAYRLTCALAETYGIDPIERHKDRR